MTAIAPSISTDDAKREVQYDADRTALVQSISKRRMG
jgi:hypothetical protein